MFFTHLSDPQPQTSLTRLGRTMVLLLLLLALLISDVTGQLDVCGKAPLNTKIVGGEDAAEGEWPWQVSLHKNNAHFCGGSLISNQWILTAAHCFSDTSTSGLTVYMGRLTQNGVNNNEVSSSVTQVINHENYNSATFDNDISLLQLSSSVTFTDQIKPVCLASQGSNIPGGTACWVTGWGKISESESLPFPGTLQGVEVPVVTNTVCEDSYSTLTSNMICAGLTEGGKDSCQGDSGGPMVVKNSTTWLQVGVVSFGKGCAQPNYPGVYARVSEYQSWIQSKIGASAAGFVEFDEATSVTDHAHVHRHLALLLMSVIHIVSALLLS